MPAASDVAALRRFAHLSPELRERLFEVEPRSPRSAVTAAEVGVSLGAVLYCPATDAAFGERFLNGRWPSMTAAVLCLEDAIGDVELSVAEELLAEVLDRIADAVEAGRSRSSLPYLFARVRSPRHLEALLRAWGPRRSAQLDGVVLPKVTVPTAAQFMTLVAVAQEGRDRPLWALPILEGPSVAHAEHRLETLTGLAELFAVYRDLVPGVRIGATDLSGVWGLRRSRDFTVYNVGAVAEVIYDIVNVFGRAGGAPAISGPVWEYVQDEPLFKPRLRETPFREEFGEGGSAVRDLLLSSAADGLVRETMLDRVNGMHGKTAIHPSHLGTIDAAYAVSSDEWADAQAILAAGSTGGVRSATVGKRMNEPKPHTLWAQRTAARAEAFGVLRPEHSFLALLPTVAT